MFLECLSLSREKEERCTQINDGQTDHEVWPFESVTCAWVCKCNDHCVTRVNVGNEKKCSAVQGGDADIC